MDFISKILLEGLYADTDSIYDVDYFRNVTPRQIKKKTVLLANLLGVDKVNQATTGSCYFVLFSPKTHFIYQVRVSNHPSGNKNKPYDVIELTYSQTIRNMINTINDKIK